MANSEMCAEWCSCPIATQSGCKKKNCFTARDKDTENHAPSGQAESTCCMPLGEQKHPILVGTVGGRMYIQADGKAIEIPLELAKEVSIGIIMAIP